jgi:threonine/homoserine/homoserine lactone efflux protein
MIPFDTILTFLTASIVLSAAPGPDNIFVLTQSAVHGMKSGVCVLLGLCTGLIFHTCAVAFGLAAIFQTYEIAFSTIKYIGACYLLFLAYKAFTADNQNISTKEEKELKYLKLYKRGIIMNITNPKVSIFFLAFLPQFTSPNNGSMLVQFFLLGLLFIISGFIVFICIVILADKIGQILKKSERIQKMLNRFSSIVFIGLALKLVATKNH